MSLLLEALKKAEKAKEEAQRRTRGEPGAAAANTPLELQQDSPAAESRAEARVLTRAELPDISKPLEILAEDLEPKPRAAEAKAPPAFTTATTGARGAAPRPQAAREAPRAASAQDERSAAKKMFEVKFKEPNPRLAFYLTMGALGAFALGTVGYFWYQLRPPASLVNLNPSPAATREVAAVAPVPAPSAVAPAPAPSSSIPGMPGAATTARPAGSQTPAIPRAAAQPPTPDPAASASPPVARQGLTLRSASNSTATPEPAPARPAPRVHPKVEDAYAAYRAGDLDAARTAYQEALREDASNRDALLGLAAVDVRSGRLEAAEATYLRLLRADPRDPHAQAALIALRGARQDPLVTESRLKNLLAADPGAHVLNFALGNQLAQQNRWSEAQQEYFKAFAADPENADFAYNLAVSLDHLRQPKLALDYYQRALALATKRGASFDVAAARSRAAQLGGGQ